MDTERMDTPAEMVRKRYTAPELIEHGDIHALVHQMPLAGTDGGSNGDNRS